MDNQKGWRIKRYITAWPVGPSIASSQTLRENFFLVDRQMTRIPSIQQLGIRQLGSRELRNSRRDRKCRKPKFERPLWLPRYVLMILRKSFVRRHTCGSCDDVTCPKPSRNPANTSFYKHLPRQEIERLHTNITNQHHLMRCFLSLYLPRSSQSILHLRAMILADLSHVELWALSEFLKHLEIKQPLYTQQNVEIM